ncbi:glycosyltransferase [Natronohydrobacter thiooxidans]|uniref:glycosyltransferase n=1 Tax=Natronohydrobacter thiooxidans TaxID=87172 RepID=UPI000B296A11|nr:glycosyltransferase [Natronohydrobacter thiooxidans]
MSGTMERTILCMKWGTLYCADYVNVLYNAARANTLGEFRFVCLTDNPEGLHPQIEHFPIPDIGLDPVHWKGGGWPKLSVFIPDLYGIKGRILFIDLDMVIWGGLDEFFTFGTGMVMLDSGPWRHGNDKPQPMSSIFAFDSGAHADMLERLSADRDELINHYYLEQDFIAGEAGSLAFWPQDWIRSFKRHIRRPLILDRFQKPLPPAEGTRVICFHGEPRPIDLIAPPAGNWDRFPHYGSGHVDWMVDYWIRHGGTT